MKSSDNLRKEPKMPPTENNATSNTNNNSNPHNYQENFERRLDFKLFLAILATGLMSFFGIVIETAMNVTFPMLMNELSIGTSTVQWLTTGYLLMLALVIPLSAYLKAKYSLKSLFIMASVLFLLGSILGGYAASFEIVLIARLLQGISTGLALPLMFNIVIEQAPLERMGLMMGVASLICAISPAVGPIFGGLIIELYDWRMIFLSLIPVIILSFLLGSYAIRQSSPLTTPSLDYLSYGFLAISFTSLLMAISFAGDSGFLALHVRLLLVVFIIGMVFFAKRTYLHPEPFIRLDIFENPCFALSALALMLVQFICLALGFLLPNYAQLVLGEMPFAAGKILLLGCLAGAFIAPISGRILDTAGAKKPILIGSLLVAGAGIIFYLHIASADASALQFMYLVFTLGQGFTAGNILTYGLRLLAKNRKSDGNAVFNTLQQLAGALGTAIIATIVATEQRLGTDMANSTLLGTQNALEIIAILGVAELIIMLYVLRQEK